MKNDVLVLYVCDSEESAVVPLSVILHNFEVSGVWQDAEHNYSEDILSDIESRGFYEGVHDGGRYCVVNLYKLASNEKTRAAMAHAFQK